MSLRVEGRLPSSWTIRGSAGLRRLGARPDQLLLAGGVPGQILEVQGAEAVRMVDDLLSGSPLGDGRVRHELARELCDRGLADPVPAPGSGAPLSDVTVVVPAYNRRAAVEELLASFGSVRSHLGGMVVVDDGSTDGTGPAAARLGAHVVGHGAPGGPARARNAGLAVVDTPLVLFIDSDCRCPEEQGWLDRLLDHVGDPSVALVAPRVGSIGGPSLAERYQEGASAADLGPAEGYIGPDRMVGSVPSGCLLVRTDPARRLGGFDTSMMAGEDIDFVYRLAATGVRMRYVPSVVIRHGDYDTLAQVLRVHRNYGRWSVAVEQLHGNQVRAVRVAAPTVIGMAAAATLHPVGLAAAVVAGLAPLVPAIRRRRGADHPMRDALAVVGRAHVGTTNRVLKTMVRSWSPVLVGASLLSWRARLVVAAVVVRRVLSRPAGPHPPGRFVAAGISIVDDAAYCAGVWESCVRRRRVTPLLPRLAPPERRHRLSALVSVDQDADLRSDVGDGLISGRTA